MSRTGTEFKPGERALLVDGRGRRYLVTLQSGSQFHSHLGSVEHDDIIGGHEGSALKSSNGSRLFAFRPTMSDYVLKMKRGAQVVYPKDIALILVYADIFPGAAVLEAGTGSGALTLALARAVGQKGTVISYETREEHHRRAADNIAAWFDQLEPEGNRESNLVGNVDLRLGDVFTEPPDIPIDRIILDLPEPWRAIGTITQTLVPGGVLCCYLPTVPQVSRTVEAMRAGGFGLINTLEGLVRTWNVEGQSVRPDHRMVAHTGFVVVARKLNTGE
jgi:tRNA (adenine57-N1/adenine58-N1)-methyltransferase catalytic subunit